MRKYSLGVFLDIFDNNKDQWKKNVAFIESLKNVEHIEILLEYLPLEEELSFFNKLRSRYKFIIHAPFFDLTLLSPHKEIAEASIKTLQKAYDIGRLIKAEAITIHAGQMPMYLSEEKTLEMLEKNLSVIKSSASLPICIENMTEKQSIQIPFPYTITHLRTIVSFSHLTLDVGHVMKSNVDPIVVLREFSKNIYDIHLHDAINGKDHLALGEGQLDLRKFLTTLDEQNYDKFVTLEVVGKEAISKSWNVLQNYL